MGDSAADIRARFMGGGEGKEGAGAGSAPPKPKQRYLVAVDGSELAHIGFRVCTFLRKVRRCNAQCVSEGCGVAHGVEFSQSASTAYTAFTAT